MSARPSPVRLDDETFELLASRALDGDLSGPEQAEFEKYLAHDSEARQRFTELKFLVEEFRALPSPEPSFALSTRVAARVQEHARGFGGVLLRFGIFRKMAPVFGLMLALGMAAVYTLTNTHPAAVQTASRMDAAKRFVPEKDVDGPVQVFFEQAETAPKAKAAGELVADRNEDKKDRALAGSAAPSAPAAGAEKPSEPVLQAAASPVPSESRDAAAAAAGVLAAAPAPAAPAAADKATTGMEEGDRSLPSGASVSYAPEPKPAKEEALAVRRQAETSKKAAPSSSLGAAGKKQPAGLSISGNQGWRIVKVPHPGELPEGVRASYVLKLDESGNVIGVTKMKISDPNAAGRVESVLRNLALSRSGSGESAREVEIHIEPE